MRVLTLDRQAFAAACRKLGLSVADSGFAPDVIVGIRRGGDYVATEMAAVVFRAATVESVSLQRPSTRSKGLIRRLLPLLPRIVLDRLRILEARVLSIRRPKTVTDLPETALPAQLRGLGAKKVLLVDDAVDSGATMGAIAGALRRANPEAELLTAVITVTTRRPLLMPDFTLYNNRTLIRFPWSMDVSR